ncbi:Myosin type-2 heavy chain 1, partial [Phlyctochytrium bullatum]
NAGVLRTIDDNYEFEETQKALSKVGVPLSMQWKIFRICVALLHLGNVKIGKSTEKEGVDLPDVDPALLKACELLGLDIQEFKKWLTHRQNVIGKDKFLIDLKYDQVLVARDSVAKFMYPHFINKNLKKESSREQNFIGVLDIYGFEHFKVNSFEQFCINYANEKLQQEFNSHVFRLEQELYIKEKIEWSMISFNDNQPCIELIEGRTGMAGILSLLDDASRTGGSTDVNLVNTLHKSFEKDKFYLKPRIGNNVFTVKHYAVDVTYTIDGFIEKNKDTVSAEQLDVLNSSKLDFLVEVLNFKTAVEDDESMGGRPVANDSTMSRKPTVGSSKKATLGSMFKQSLVQLMTTIRATESHRVLKRKGLEEASAIKIQALWRGHTARKEYRAVLRRVVYVQSVFRRIKARKIYKQLKEEARSVGKLKEVNYTLESKLVEVSRQMEEKRNEVKELQRKVEQQEAQINDWREKFAKVAEAKKSITNELNATNVNAKELQQLREERESLAKDRDRLAALVKDRDKELASQTEELWSLRQKEKYDAQSRVLEMDELIQEVSETLVLRLPIAEELTNVEDGFSNSRDYLFPAHIIGYIIAAMLHHGMLFQIRDLSNRVLRSIQAAGSEPEDDFKPLFWTSNCFELCGIVQFLYQSELSKPNNKAQTKLLKKLQDDLDALSRDILTTYLIGVKKHVASMSVAAILLTQDLPGLKSEQVGFWGMVFGDSNDPKNMDYTES